MNWPRSAISSTSYRILNVLDLPSDLSDSLMDSLNLSNDCGKIVNPQYHPDLAEWLKANGEDPTECFIAWASW